jgi:hypothetical protein
MRTTCVPDIFTFPGEGSLFLLEVSTVEIEGDERS